MMIYKDKDEGECFAGLKIALGMCGIDKNIGIPKGF